MKISTSLLAGVLALLASPAPAQSMGTLTEKGVSMDVTAAVLVLDESKPALTLHLLPFQPSAGEVSELQTGSTFWLLKKQSPDTKKWKDCPFGKLELSWSMEKESAPDPKKATFFLYSYGVGEQGSNLNVNKLGTSVEVSLAGSLRAGQDVTLTTKGSDKLGSSTIAWDLKVRGRILALKKK